MVGNEPIANFALYNSEMSKSMIDKIFFMDKIDDSIRVIVDYGCADGSLIHFLAPLFPDMIFVGYDLDETMVAQAEAKNAAFPNCYAISDLVVLQSILKETHTTINQCAVILSSLIHEVYSYSNDVDGFWNTITTTGFKYIIIRDMCLDETAHRPALKEDLIKVKSRYPMDKIREFEHIHGSICDNYNLIHFLLKYRYRDNWDREVRENYVPCSVEEIARQLGQNYTLIYFDHYILPYLAATVKKDFDITLKDYTHIKFIYQLKFDKIEK